MPRNHIDDMHSEAWWMRVVEGKLTPDENRRWQEHLVHCQTCHQEWETMTRVDMLLRTATPPPLLPEDFTMRTIELITRKQKLRRLLSFITGVLIFTLVAGVGLTYFDVTLTSLVRAANAVISSRQILFAALVRTLIELTIAVKTLLPLMLGVTGAVLLFITPNGMMATAAVLWYSRRQRARDAATS